VAPRRRDAEPDSRTTASAAWSGSRGNEIRPKATQNLPLLRETGFDEAAEVVAAGVMPAACGSPGFDLRCAARDLRGFVENLSPGEVAGSESPLDVSRAAAAVQALTPVVRESGSASRRRGATRYLARICRPGGLRGRPAALRRYCSGFRACYRGASPAKPAAAG